jgi:hypothetical protein
MKKLFTLAFTLLSGYAFSQCTLTGLQSFYCASDSGNQLSASCVGGGNIQIVGPGVDPNGFFTPGLAGEDSIPISVIQGGATYTIDQSGTFAPDTTAGGTTVSLGDDQVSGDLQIGFPFRFFGDFYTQFRISSNGFITFSSTTNSGCCSGDFIPDTWDPNNLIAFAWEDLDPAGVGSINYQTVGTAPNRKLIVNFVDIPHWPGPGPNANVTSQVQLWEGCGKIEIHTTTKPSNGITTMGIENSTGTAGYAAPGRNSTFWSTNNDYTAFIPNCGDTFWTFVSGGPDLDAILDSNDCFGDTDGAISLTATGASPFTYAWSNGATTSAITGLTGGTYTVSATDGDNCIREEEYDVYSPPALGNEMTSEDAICETGPTGEISSAVFGGTPPYSYAWSNGATTPAQSAVDAGSYQLTVTDGNGCEGVFQGTVDYIYEDPIVDLGDDVTICPSSVALLVSQPGYMSYVWSNGDTNSSTIVSSAGVYAVTVTTEDGCEGADDLEVIAAIPVEVDLGENLSGLGPINVSAAAPGLTQFLWNTGSTNDNINVAVSGTFTVTAADSNGCTSTDNIRVDIWPSSVGEIAENGGLLVYPNPANAFVNIVPAKAMTGAELILMDIQGRVVLQQEANLNQGEQLMLNVSDLPAGTYMLRVSDEENDLQRQIIIQ